MPPAGYLSASGIESCLVWLSKAYPSITDLIVLPDTSVEGRTSRAVKIAKGGGKRRGVLLIGGVHAREIVNPDGLVSLALRICQSYKNGTDIVLGPKTWAASTIKLLVETLDIFIFPLVNPDGRVFVQDPAGDAWWRKNRRVNQGTSCRGVDINRNYDFLWSSVIGQTSSSPCSDTYHGTAPFSEPETMNVRWLLDEHEGIECFVDVHSYSELVLYPWGDDDNQSTDATQNFQNPAWNGLRGTLGSGYAEYIAPADSARYIDHGNDMRDAIAAVNGNVYTVEEGSELYPTCGTSQDYAYSRHLVDGSLAKVWGYTLETGTSFQPEYAAGLAVIDEAQSGLLQFMVSCLCPIVDSGVASGLSASSVANLRTFRDTTLGASPRGRELAHLLERHGAELIELASRDDRLRSEASKLLGQFAKLVNSESQRKPAAVDSGLVDDVVALLDRAEGASEPLRRTLGEVRKDLEAFRGRTLGEGLAALAGGPHAGHRGDPAGPATVAPAKKAARKTAKKAASKAKGPARP